MLPTSVTETGKTARCWPEWNREVRGPDGAVLDALSHKPDFMANVLTEIIIQFLRGGGGREGAHKAVGEVITPLFTEGAHHLKEFLGVSSTVL